MKHEILNKELWGKPAEWVQDSDGHWRTSQVDHDPPLHLSKPYAPDAWACVFADSTCEDCYNEQGEDNPCRAKAREEGLIK